jgi:cation diffusion facilitator family transporter
MKDTFYNPLFKAFIPRWEEVRDRRVRDGYGKVAGVVGILSNLFLCGAKVIVGLLAGSIAIIADGINNLADASSSVITLVGFRLAAMPEDKAHPYGHARIEYLTSLVISGLIILVGIGLLKSSVDKIIHPTALNTDWITVIILVIAIGVKLWQAGFNRAAGRRIDSLALLATATDSRNDVISTSAVLGSVLVAMFTPWIIDGYVGALVALFIIWSGILLIRDSSSPLLGEAPDPKMVQDIVGITRSFSGVKGIHDLMVHNYGPGRIFCSIHVEVDAEDDIMKSHDMVDNIESALKEELKIHAVVHMDPIKVGDPLVEHLNGVLEGTIAQLEGVSEIHDLRVVPGETHTNVIFDCVLGTECPLKEEEIRNQVEEELKKENPSYNVVITFDQHYTYLDNKEQKG